MKNLAPVWTGSQVARFGCLQKASKMEPRKHMPKDELVWLLDSPLQSRGKIIYKILGVLLSPEIGTWQIQIRILKHILRFGALAAVNMRPHTKTATWTAFSKDIAFQGMTLLTVAAEENKPGPRLLEEITRPCICLRFENALLL